MKCDNCGRATPTLTTLLEREDLPNELLEIRGVVFCFRRGCVKDYNQIKYGMPDGTVA